MNQYKTALIVIVGGMAAYFLYQRYGGSMGSGPGATGSTTAPPNPVVSGSNTTTVKDLFDAFTTVFKAVPDVVSGIQKSLG